MDHGKSCRGQLVKGKCDASCDAGLCSAFLDAVQEFESDAVGR